jgi:hypothetical protein
LIGDTFFYLVGVELVLSGELASSAQQAHGGLGSYRIGFGTCVDEVRRKDNFGPDFWAQNIGLIVEFCSVGQNLMDLLQRLKRDRSVK